KMSMWNLDSITDCMRGDLAYAMDYGPEGTRTIQISGLADSEKCRGAFTSALEKMKSNASGKALVEQEVLEPEKVTTYVETVRLPESLTGGERIGPDGMKNRMAEVRDVMISGTDEWASKAIREAAAARDGSLPAGGGLVLADLGPLAQRPGIFGRVQIGTLMRQQDAATKARQSRRAAGSAAEDRGKGRAAKPIGRDGAAGA